MRINMIKHTIDTLHVLNVKSDINDENILIILKNHALKC